MSQQNPFQQGQPGPQPGQPQGQPQPGFGPQPGQPQPGYGPQPGAQPGFGPQPGAQPGYGPQAGHPGYGAQPGYAGAPGYGQAPGANPYAAPTADLGGALEPGIEPPVELSTMEAVKWSFKATGLGNLAMGLLLLIIPMVGPVLLQGWMAQIHRRLVRREGPAVRSFQFDQFSDTLKAGLVPFLVQMAGSMIIMIPMMIIMAVGFGFITAIAAGGGGGSAGGIVVGLGALGMFVFIVGLSLAAGVVLKAFTIRAELTGDLKAAFDFKAGMAMVKRQFKPMLVHMVLLTLISIPLSFAGLLVFFIGVYIVAVALSFAQLHLRWQMYELDIKSGGEVLEVYPGMGAKL